MAQRYAVIHSGVVVNVVMADSVEAAGAEAVQSDAANIGDTYSGGVFTTLPPPPPPVPGSVSMAQARIALARAGVSESTVDAVIAGMPDGAAKVEAGIWWNKSNEVFRNHPFVLSLAPALGLDSAELDDLFRVAATI